MATAERQAEWMRSNAQPTARAPRADMPASSRPNMEPPSASVAAPPAEPPDAAEPAPAPPPRSSRRRKSAQAVERMLDAFYAAEPHVHSELLPAERARVRRALCSPSRPWERALYVHPELTALASCAVVALACYYLPSAGPPCTTPYRATRDSLPHPAPSRTQRVVERVLGALTHPR